MVGHLSTVPNDTVAEAYEFDSSVYCVPNGKTMETRKYSISIGDPFTVPNIEQVGYTANWSEISTSDCTSVSSATQLSNMTGTYAYKLSSDISLSGNWTPISGFSGYLNGNGYTISGSITITPDANNNAGLFGLLSNAYIVNLKLKLTITVSNTGSNVSAGILAGTMSEDSVVLSNTVEDSSLSVYSRVAYAGFIAGTASSALFSRCEATNSAIAASSSSTKKGALAGVGNNTTIYDCSYSTCSGVSANFGESVSGTTWAVNLWDEESGDSENSVNFCNSIDIQERGINSDVVTSQNQALLRPEYWGFGTHNAGEVFTPSTMCAFDEPAYIIFPHYTANTYTIKYNGNGATGGSMSDSCLLFGQGNKISAVGFTREGAIFAGWSLSNTATSATYANACSLDTIAVGANNDGATINLYAVWNIVSANLTFNNNGATTSGTTSMNVLAGGALPNITVPVKTNYQFWGYYTQQNGQGTKIYNADGTPSVTVSTFTTNTTLYAHYLEDPYAVYLVGSTTSFTKLMRVADDNLDGGLMLTPASGYKVSEFSFDNDKWYPVEYCSTEIGNTSVAMRVTCLANENKNYLYFIFEGIFCDGAVPLYIKTTSGVYSGLKTAGGSVSGVVVTATLGGTAYIVGDDFENLEDSDTITVSTILCQPGYDFVGWYLDDDRTTAISTNTSYRVTKAEAFGHTLVAVYQPTTNNSVNLEVDNT